MIHYLGVLLIQPLVSVAMETARSWHFILSLSLTTIRESSIYTVTWSLVYHNHYVAYVMVEKNEEVLRVNHQEEKEMFFV